MVRVRQFVFRNVQEARYQFSGLAEMGVTFGRLGCKRET